MSETKTPEQMAEKEVNKSLGKSIARRQLEIKKHQASIKKLEKEIAKIKSGELVPEESDSSVFSSDTVVAFLLDESGSMDMCLKETISGFNEYVQSLKKTKDKVFLTLTKFNSVSTTIVYKNKEIHNVSKLNEETYIPDGMTPLYDAIGKTISALTKELTNVLKPKVLFVVMTDGQENSSGEYNLEAIKKLIKRKETEDWSFLYMGADQDAWLNSKDMGFAKGNVLSFASANVRGTMARAGGMSASYANSKKRRTNVFFVGSK